MSCVLKKSEETCMKRILLTAEHSYIGCSFKRYLSSHWEEYEVDCISQRDSVWKKTDFAKYDVVVDVTGIAHVDQGSVNGAQASEYKRVNAQLALETACLAKEARVRQFIYLSSMIVYGDSAPLGESCVISGNTKPAPASAYGASKLQAEQGLLAMEDDHFTVAIVRPPMVYGPGCKGNYPKLAKLAKWSPVFPKVENCRSMIYIDHLCELLRLIIDGCDGGIFMPQNREQVNTGQMVQLIGRVHHAPVLLLPGFDGLLRLLAKKVSLVNKVFGNFAYASDMGDYYGGTYQLYSFAETIALTERKAMPDHRLKDWKCKKKIGSRKQYLKVKRYLDCLLCLGGLLLLWPLFAGICIAIKLDSKGPVFFRQKRVGCNKKIFEIYKFRTMYTDTPKDMPTHLLKDPEQYITRVGKFLRKTSLDELPQIINILEGDMSLVGPRPALWNQDDLIRERDRYHANQLPPGLTGWAQIHGRDELEIPEKAALDGYYVKHFGLLMDIRCLVGTVSAVLLHKGVKEGGTGGK